MSSHRTKADARPTGGFVLIEALVAVAVAGIIMAALLHKFSNTWSGITAVRENAEAMLLTRSILATAAPRTGLTAGTQKGTLGRYSWSVTVTQPPLAAPPPPAKPEAENGAPAAEAWSLYRLDAVVTAPSGRSTRVETYRLSRAKS